METASLKMSDTEELEGTEPEDSEDEDQKDSAELEENGQVIFISIIIFFFLLANSL